MAIISRPSLRSSSRQAGFPNSSATERTVTQHNTSPPTRNGKRPYLLTNGDESAQVIKKQKLNLQQHPRPVIIPRNHTTKTSSNAVLKSAPKGVTHDVDPTSRSTNAVQPLANGTIITNGEHAPVPIEVTKIRESKETDKRTLRSQDGGSRSKSELSLYFPNYEELISNEPKEPEFLTPGTRIYVSDGTPKSPVSKFGLTKILRNAVNTFPPQPPAMVNGSSQTSTPINTNKNGLTDAQKVDFSSIDRHTRHSTSDPLTPNIYFKAHRRAERQEKQLRNIEKERAQHEKVQLERLLDGLKGHDWLRVMGISGITDSEKKSFEPKRDWFVREVSSLIEKFRVWKEEEKRRKVEKDQSIAADEDDEDEGEDDEEEEEMSDTDAAIAIAGPPPAPNDLDAWAARQLHQEAISASTLTLQSTSTKPLFHLSAPSSSLSAHHTPNALAPPPLEKPFTSFFSKPHLRDAAISKHRRGRTRFAFGQVVPEVRERVFELPGGYLTEEAIRASKRRGRRMRRSAAGDGGGG